MKAKFLFAVITVSAFFGQSALAGKLSGEFTNEVCTSELIKDGVNIWKDLPSAQPSPPSGFVHRYEATDAGLTKTLISVIIDGQEFPRQDGLDNPEFLLVGDFVSRPDQFLIDRGYTLVDRKIVTLDDDKDEYTLKDFIFNVKFSDDEGIQLGWASEVNNFDGLHYTESFKADDKGLTVLRRYYNGETYTCRSTRR